MVTAANVFVDPALAAKLKVQSAEHTKADARSGTAYFGTSDSMKAERRRIRQLLLKFNATDGDSEEARALLKEIIPSCHDSATVTPPLLCDHGDHITLAENVYLNFNTVFADEAEVSIGANTLIGPNCSFYTPNHPTDPDQRRTGVEIARPIVVEEDVWLGGSVTVCPGVTIGRGSTIGAGSVVVKSIPPHSVAVGNPCRVIKTLPGFAASAESK
eukprot:Gregarina_sp_Pseudo_9__5268@NODE_602_length_2508_cov_2911_910490_g568_i0_p1_GENE_NODE_602_length_2508_cov_2911_910490_g568_i0NODE_602_length_2508_cov_2911_910490_g568_i0_p1_ORF_typecomplete_len215_score46_95Hexapep_2/PF14602_6/7_7e03Hexapep_2/PF14602_6/0_011Hexapep_2/PF14602_6/5_9e09Hexapep/PF00132_24/0_023Hexapep/PF00132_24/2_1e07Mac/PF12464_8/9_6e07Mac/PF12464_8/3_5e03_NODE_602_length_2508_cov_2911_910490_g568_i013962040